MEGEGQMNAKLTLAVFVVTLQTLLGCPILPAQTEDAKPILKPIEMTRRECDSLKNPVPEESLVSAGDRTRAWEACLEKVRNIKV
jgi:hypothetical protein